MASSDLTLAPKLVRLVARPDVNVRIDPNARMAAFTCAHPDGLLGTYEVVLTFAQIKRVAGAIISSEGAGELQQQRAKQPQIEKA